MRNDTVNRAAVMDALVREYNRRYLEHHEAGLKLAWIEKAVNEVPTIDAEPVIRCKDCAYYLTGYEQTRYCAKDGILKRETYYCAGAERKEDDS